MEVRAAVFLRCAVMKKKKQKQKQQQKDPQEVKVKVKYKRSLWSIIKFILGIAFVGLIVFFLLGILSMCDSKIKVPWSGWFDNPFGIFDTEQEEPKPEEKPVIQYTVSFYSDGSLFLEVAVEEGKTVGDKMPPDPVRDGYVFTGWASNQGAFTKDTVVSGNMTIYALFELNHEHVYTASPVEEPDDVGHEQVVYRCTVCGDELYRALHEFYLDPEAATGETDEYGHEITHYVCRLCGETSAMPEHEYTDGVCTLCGDEENTCDHEIVNGVCTICGTVFDEFHDIPFGEICNEHVDENDDGKCDNCGADMSDVPDVPCEEHVDENGDGKCDKCGADMPEEPEPPHEHTFSDAWTSDGSGHWHAATCEHKDEISGFASHNFVEGVCSVCGYVAPHEHTFSDEWTSDESGHWHAATCEHTDVTSGFAAHEWDDGGVVKEPTCAAEGERVYTCTVCGYERTESIPTTAHDLSYHYDENGHWQECANCDYQTSSEPHNFDGSTCTFCGYVAPHEHTFSAEWTSDENNHWHAATCGHDVTSGFAPHEWDSGKVVKDPSCTTEGERVYTCTDCGYERTESIAQTEHNLSYNFDESGHWQECADCGHRTPVTEHDDKNDDGVCDDCGWEMTEPCDDFNDSDEDGLCDTCGLTGEAHWNGSRPGEYQNNGAYAPSISQSQGLGYDPQDYDSSLEGFYGNQGVYSSACYPSEDVPIAAFSELTPMGLDYKVSFIFDVGVMNWFWGNGFSGGLDGTLMLYGGGSLGYAYTLAFDFDVPAYFREYFGFSSLTIEGPYLGQSPVGLSYSIENGGLRLVGELGLPAEYVSTDYMEIYLLVRIYMGTPDIEPHIEFYRNGDDGPWETPYTAYTLGPNARDEILLYVALPGDYQITGILEDDGLTAASSELSPFSFACLYLKCAMESSTWLDYFINHDGDWGAVKISFTEYSEDYYRDDIGDSSPFSFTVSDGETVESAPYGLSFYAELTDFNIVTVYFSLYSSEIADNGFYFNGVEITISGPEEDSVSVEKTQYSGIGVILTFTFDDVVDGFHYPIYVIFDVANP